MFGPYEAISSTGCASPTLSVSLHLVCVPAPQDLYSPQTNMLQFIGICLVLRDPRLDSTLTVVWRVMSRGIISFLRKKFLFLPLLLLRQSVRLLPFFATKVLLVHAHLTFHQSLQDYFYRAAPQSSLPCITVYIIVRGYYFLGARFCICPC